MMKLPTGISIHAAPGEVTSVSGLSLLPDRADFPRTLDADKVPVDLQIVLFDTKAECDAYQAGFINGNDNDGTTSVTESIRVNGQCVFAMLIVCGDSDDEAVRVDDHRTSAAGEKE